MGCEKMRVEAMGLAAQAFEAAFEAVVPDASFEGATRLNKYTAFLYIRNHGRKGLRIVRYSIDMFELVIRPPLIVAPGALAWLYITRGLSYGTELEQDRRT